MVADQLLLGTVFFSVLGFATSNLYIVVFLRRNDDFELGPHVAVYLGDIRNYRLLNNRFVNCFRRPQRNVALNRCVSVLHVAAPLLFPAAFLLAIVSELWSAMAG